MDHIAYRIAAAMVCACFYLAATSKLLGVMQQGGYKGGKCLRWLFGAQNTYFLRLTVWGFFSFIACLLVSLAFSFLPGNGGLIASIVPFFLFAILFVSADRSFALKVKMVSSGRVKRLGIVYLFLCAVVAFVVITLCSMLGVALQGQAEWLQALRYLPVCFLPMFLPFVLCLANALTAPFENARNRKFIKRAGQVLNETDIVRVGIVGSYGKTSVKNILKALLSEGVDGAVVATPASYNTPIGVAKTVTGEAFKNAKIFLCEMGARKAGDIQELCDLVKPDYIVFTGVCAQHIESFGSEKQVLLAKCEALHSTAKKIICAASLKEKIEALSLEASVMEKCVFVEEAQGVEIGATQTSFAVTIAGEEVRVQTPLLGSAAAENCALAIRLCEEMGVQRETIVSALEKVHPIPHRLQLIQSNGVSILDDAYNCNLVGAAMALEVLQRFENKRFVVTPGIVETGVLHAEINGALGQLLAKAGVDRVILVGETQVLPVKKAYLAAGGEAEKLTIVNCLQAAQTLLAGELSQGDCVLFMNDLPDVL